MTLPPDIMRQIEKHGYVRCSDGYVERWLSVEVDPDVWPPLEWREEVADELGFLAYVNQPPMDALGRRPWHDGRRW